MTVTSIYSKSISNIFLPSFLHHLNNCSLPNNHKVVTTAQLQSVPIDSVDRSCIFGQVISDWLYNPLVPTAYWEGFSGSFQGLDSFIVMAASLLQLWQNFCKVCMCYHHHISLFWLIILLFSSPKLFLSPCYFFVSLKHSRYVFILPFMCSCHERPEAGSSCGLYVPIPFWLVVEWTRLGIS